MDYPNSTVTKTCQIQTPKVEALFPLFSMFDAIVSFRKVPCCKLHFTFLQAFTNKLRLTHPLNLVTDTMIEDTLIIKASNVVYTFLNVGDLKKGN